MSISPKLGLSTAEKLHKKIFEKLIHSKRRCACYGDHGTFNVVFAD
jgi:hypothetical protein